ncbi:MAG: M48 family metallopeptidase [Microgenomates group bacterium]
MAVFIALVVGIAYVFGNAYGYGDSFVGYAIIFSVISSVVSLYFGDSIVLAMSGARPANRETDFDFYTVAENVSIAAGVPAPKLYVIEDMAMNAFATGRDPKHAVVCATVGLLKKLDRREIEGVVAHEMSHVKNYDIRLMAIVAVLVGTIAYASDLFMRNLWWRDRDSDRKDGGIFMIIGIVLAIISPLIASLIQLAISRKREYLADATAALTTRYPEGLARALEKISKESVGMKKATTATAHLFISNPFKNKKSKVWFAGLFDTHPPITERIKILRSM